LGFVIDEKCSSEPHIRTITVFTGQESSLTAWFEEEEKNDATAKVDCESSETVC
jgi:hypothetical protein